MKKINDIAVRAPCTGMIIVGGGLVKHHVCNANLMRNGADFAVFINTGECAGGGGVTGGRTGWGGGGGWGGSRINNVREIFAHQKK